MQKVLSDLAARLGTPLESIKDLAWFNDLIPALEG